MRHRLAEYLRLSQDDMDDGRQSVKDESNSIRAQRLLCNNYVQEHDDLREMEVVEFVDDGYTGTNFDRPGFQSLLDSIRRGEIQCVIMKDLSRLGRDYLQIGDYLEHVFPFLGVRCIAINDNYDSAKYIGTTGGIEVAFKNLIYQRYSQDLSQKVKSAMHLRMEKGEYVTHCPYGYMKKRNVKHKMYLDPEAAPIVREIFLDVIAGRTTTEIAVDLNARGIPTPSEHKGIKRSEPEKKLVWTHRIIVRIIREIKYTGTMANFRCKNMEIHAKSQVRIPKDKWVIHENKHEAIVTYDEYARANEVLRSVKMSKRVRSDTRDRIYFCAHCGHKLRKTYGLDEYFSCETKSFIENSACSKIYCRKTDLERVLVETYRAQLLLMEEELNNVDENRNIGILEEHEQYRNQLTRDIANCDTKRLQQYEAYRAGKMDKETFLAQKIDLLEEKERLNKKLEEVKGKIEDINYQKMKKESEKRKIKLAVRGFKLSDEELRDEMLEAVDKVLVFSNDEIEICWKQKDIFGKVMLQRKGA